MVRRAGLTTDFESVRSALDAVTVVGDTSLRDALFLALHTAAPEATRPLLLIFMDGADTSSLLLADAAHADRNWCGFIAGSEQRCYSLADGFQSVVPASGESSELSKASFFRRVRDWASRRRGKSAATGSQHSQQAAPADQSSIAAAETREGSCRREQLTAGPARTCRTQSVRINVCEPNDPRSDD